MDIQFGNLTLFWPLWFSNYRKSKTAIFLQIWRLLIFWKFGIFHTRKCQKFSRIQNSELLLWSKWQISLISHKILKFLHWIIIRVEKSIVVQRLVTCKSSCCAASVLQGCVSNQLPSYLLKTVSFTHCPWTFYLESISNWK